MVEDEGHTSGAVGVPVREADRVEWKTAEEIHRLIAAQTVAPVSEGVIRDKSREINEIASSVLTDIEDSQDWGDRAVYHIQALPSRILDNVPELYERRRGGIWGNLMHEPPLRPQGFNLRLGVSPSVIEGALTIRDSRQAIWIDPRGIVTASALANPSFLGWAINDRASDGRMVINPITLVEMTLEFLRFQYQNLIVGLADESITWSGIVSCSRFQSGQVHLTGGWDPHATLSVLREDAQPATSESWSRAFDIHGDPEADAFAALTRVFALFGLPPSQFPVASGNRVEEEQFLRA